MPCEVKGLTGHGGPDAARSANLTEGDSSRKRTVIMLATLPHRVKRLQILAGEYTLNTQPTCSAFTASRETIPNKGN